MDEVLKQLVDRIDEYIGGLIDVAAMSETDKKQLKHHLLAAQDILLKNGVRELHEVVSGLTRAILSRF